MTKRKFKLHPLSEYIKNKSLRWRIMTCIIVAMLFMLATLVITTRIEFNSLDIIGGTYKSNLELNQFTENITETEKAMENYVSYHTFESIDSYFSYKNNVETYSQTMQDAPSINVLLQKEYIVNQLSKSFAFYSGKAVAARRSNDFDNLNFYYEKTLLCYNFLMSELSELNSLLLQQNALNYQDNMDSVNLMSQISLTFFITFSVFIIVILYLTITKLTKPLVEISEIAHRVSRRDFDVPLFNKNTNDEIGNICNAFDRMIISIREYIDTIWEKAITEAELKEKEIEMQALYADAQLRALQNQINPHFLFNTLNTGAQLAMMEGADKTCYFIEQVADFFRYNIQQKQQSVSIDEELNLVDNFVYIMSVRFGSRLQFVKDIPEQSFPEKIPVMTLQPLVENCIKHGLANAVGKVVLKVERKTKYINISISDNGGGISGEVREQVLQAVKSDKKSLQDVLVTLDANSAVKKNEGSNGTGLISVFLRLKLFFHRDDIFDIENNQEQGGTTFLIRIPV